MCNDALIPAGILETNLFASNAKKISKLALFAAPVNVTTVTTAGIPFLPIGNRDRDKAQVEWLTKGQRLAWLAR